MHNEEIQETYMVFIPEKNLIKIGKSQSPMHRAQTLKGVLLGVFDNVAEDSLLFRFAQFRIAPRSEYHEYNAAMLDYARTQGRLPYKYNMDSAPEKLTIDEISLIAGKSPVTVLGWLRSGNLSNLTKKALLRRLGD